MKPYLIFLFLIIFPRLAVAETMEPVVMPELETRSSSFVPSKSDKREPYRVFFPIDRFQKVIGETVHIPLELLQLLSKNIKETGTEQSHRWNIERAEYQGSLIHHPLTQDVELSDDFKAVYDIDLETENVTIILPPLPVLQDRVFWDSKPIQPIWRAADNSSENGTWMFNIENEKKGKHRLELSLIPKPEERDKIRRIAFDIPKVPNAVLHLRTPQDIPPVVVTESFGAVTSNSLISPNLTAEIGPSNKLVFSWSNESGRSDATTADVEQLFWLRVKPTQVEIHVIFRYRIEGGRVRYLNILTDPRWLRSGPFHCEEYPIEQTETYLDSTGPDGLPSAQNEITRLDFKTPVSGTLTISAGFVLRDFNGIGKIRLPQFRAQKSRITKSMLALSAEPVMELDYPDVGLGSGFEAAWRSTGTTEDRPLAQYDLTKTNPSWMLAIRTKNQTPTIKTNQSIRFDDGDSTLSCLGEFFAVGEVFLQRFSVPDSFQIDSVDVRDARQNPVDIRIAEYQRERLNHIIFFKRAMTGKYAITIQGHFATETKNNLQRLPLIVFDEVKTEEQLLNVFRTSAVITDFKAAGTDWVESEVTPVAPKSFQDVLPVSSWRRTVPDSSSLLSSSPSFVLVPNKPTVRGEQITTLSKGTADQWNVTFDVLWDISNGELDTIRFHWDEQCGSVNSIEPAIPYTLEQAGNHFDLVLTQKVPFTDKRHFRIKTTLNTPGASVSVPKLVPELTKAEKVELKTFVILPQQADGELIPWNLNHLEAVEETTRKALEEKTTGPLEEGKVVIPGSLLIVSDEMIKIANSEEPPNPESRLFFRATGTADDFTAIITHESSISVATLYDIHFFIKSDGGFFGSLIVDLKSRGQDSFILRMPPGYELIRVNSSGLGSKETRLRKDQWKMELWSSDYPQRIKIVFRGFLTPENQGNAPASPLSLVRLNKEKLAMSLEFPVLEGISVQETLWTVSFETQLGEFFPPLEIYSSHKNQTIPSNAEKPGGDSVSLGQHVPAFGDQVTQTLLKLNLIRLENLLNVLNSVSTPSQAKSEEVKRWFAHWSDEWFALSNRVDFQTANLPATATANKHLLLLDPADSVSHDSETGLIETILEAKNLTFIEALMQRYQTGVSMKFPSTEKPANRRKPQFLFENSPIPLCDRMMENASHIFGASETPIREIRLESNPPGAHWPFFLRNHQLNRSLLWTAIVLFFLVLSTRFHFWEPFIQFPHFWGAMVGLLLWNLFPPGFFGVSILLITLFSFLYPAWKRHGELVEQNLQ